MGHPVTSQTQGFAQADAKGHGTLASWHDGCRCPWCASKARERGCLCPPCVGLRASSTYVEIPTDPPLARTGAVVSPQPVAPVRTNRKELK
ncbi:MAG: hypothetical protein WBL53_01110 [Pseudonocardiaceae bacterium]